MAEGSAALDEPSPNTLRQLLDRAYGEADDDQEKAHLSPATDAHAVYQLQTNASGGISLLILSIAAIDPKRFRSLYRVSHVFP